MSPGKPLILRSKVKVTSHEIHCWRVSLHWVLVQYYAYGNFETCFIPHVLAQPTAACAALCMYHCVAAVVKNSCGYTFDRCSSILYYTEIDCVLYRVVCLELRVKLRRRFARYVVAAQPTHVVSRYLLTRPSGEGRWHVVGAASVYRPSSRLQRQSLPLSWWGCRAAAARDTVPLPAGRWLATRHGRLGSADRVHRPTDR